MNIIFIFFGIFLCPIMTLGMVLVYFGHPVIGAIAVAYSLLYYKKFVNLMKDIWNYIW